MLLALAIPDWIDGLKNLANSHLPLATFGESTILQFSRGQNWRNNTLDSLETSLCFLRSSLFQVPTYHSTLSPPSPQFLSSICLSLVLLKSPFQPKQRNRNTLCKQTEQITLNGFLQVTRCHIFQGAALRESVLPATENRTHFQKRGKSQKSCVTGKLWLGSLCLVCFHSAVAGGDSQSGGFATEGGERNLGSSHWGRQLS